MGSRWDISRTSGQIHALLYVSPSALNADDIGEALAFSRSNVSMGLKELQSWNLVRLQHWPNDQPEYFQAPDPVWAIFRTLAEERRKREIDSPLSMPLDALMEQPAAADDIHAQACMTQKHDLIELMTGWLTDVQKMDPATLVSLMKMSAKVEKLPEVKNKIASTVKSGIGKRVAPDVTLPHTATATAQPSGVADPASPGPDADGQDSKEI